MSQKPSCSKGIILAGGAGTRLYPVTRAVSKQLLPVYDKPMVYYPLSTLMWAGIREVLVISTPQDIGSFERLLGDGRTLGVNIHYAVQPDPGGIAQALLIGKSFIDQSNVALVLGDNIFYGHGLPDMVRRAAEHSRGATLFAYPVRDPQRYGIVEFNQQGQVTSLIEKPENPPSNQAVVGLYFYDSQAVEIAESLQPSSRGELEITDVNREYLRRGQLRVEPFGRGFAWLGTGTHESLMQASEFVAAIEQRQGLKIACLEEVAYRAGFINAQQVLQAAESIQGDYGQYLRSLIDPTAATDQSRAA